MPPDTAASDRADCGHSVAPSAAWRAGGYEILGPGTAGPWRARPILCVPGLWHCASAYDRFFLPYLRGHGYRAFAFSFRGSGGSMPREPYWRMRLSEYVEDLTRVIDALGLVDPILLAHSFGGLVVMKYLEEHPRTSAAVLLASVPPSGTWRATLRYLKRHPARYVALVRKRSLLPVIDGDDRAAEMFLSPRTPDGERWRLASNVRGLLQDGPFLAYAESNNPFYLRPRRVRTPLLSLSAGDDAIFGPGDAAEIARRLRCDAATVDGIGHGMMYDARWREVARRVVDWLAARSLA